MNRKNSNLLKESQEEKDENINIFHSLNIDHFSNFQPLKNKE